jgi:HAD superfamily hydrolase (TIGR01490 family)
MISFKEGIAVFDLDRTITTFGTFTPYLVETCGSRRVKYLGAPKVAYKMLCYKVGIITRTQLKEQMLKIILGGRHRDRIVNASEYYMDSIEQTKLRPGALKKIEEHKKKGHLLVMATASMDFYAQAIADRLGFDMVIATKSCWDGDRLLPTIDGENCYGPNKLVMLKDRFKAEGINTKDFTTYAYSDHVSDLPFLEWADKPVAVNPSKKLLKRAKELNIPIEDWGP